MKKLLAAVMISAVLGMSGCGTMFQTLQPKGPAMFGGTRLLVQQFGHEQSHIGDCIFYALDLPISFAFDAAFILVSAINELYEGGIDVEPQHPRTLGYPVYVAEAQPAPTQDAPAGPELASLRH
jgi:uncharacterized protein YceK